jgi:hypothetical protein
LTSLKTQREHTTTMALANARTTPFGNIILPPLPDALTLESLSATLISGESVVILNKLHYNNLDSKLVRIIKIGRRLVRLQWYIEINDNDLLDLVPKIVAPACRS